MPFRYPWTLVGIRKATTVQGCACGTHWLLQHNAPALDLYARVIARISVDERMIDAEERCT